VLLLVFLILAVLFYFEDEDEDEEDSLLPAYDEADELAPEAHLRVVHAVDGAVGPFGGCGGNRRGVGVAGRGVKGQRHKALAIAAIHLNFAHV